MVGLYFYIIDVLSFYNVCNEYRTWHPLIGEKDLLQPLQQGGKQVLIR